jgi:putative ABC transport system ATP-binding protein/lipoprotein-releasing system ATP-binding protein
VTSPPTQPAVRLHGLTYRIEDRLLFDGLELEVERGRSLAVLGPSGCGKSTLLSVLLGLAPPDAGTVEIAGAGITGMSPRRRARHRRDHMGMVFQFGELLPELSPVENVALAGLLAGLSRKQATERARDLLGRLGVPLAARTTARLSGGERQRTAVARAIVNRPAVLLADEPTGALDEHNRETVADLLFSLPAEYDCALVVVTHDRQVARRADRRLLLSDGSLRPDEPLETVR